MENGKWNKNPHTHQSSRNGYAHPCYSPILLPNVPYLFLSRLIKLTVTSPQKPFWNAQNRGNFLCFHQEAEI
uniref:Uncharacterized protein n=1 Tax=Anguilla anguilla TaxID=7936 RepID=A0A0E9VL80_ANGAN